METTQRGFAVYGRLTDDDGTLIRLQQSSAESSEGGVGNVRIFLHLAWTGAKHEVSYANSFPLPRTRGSR